jgi:hypothetical protein
MEMKTFTFGDVILYCEEQYVFLCGTPEIIYLAKIINGKSDNGVALKRLSERLIDDATQQPAKQNVKNALFCFITLSTEKYEGDLAHLADSQKPFSPQIIKTEDKLSREDIIKLKNKILGEDIVPKKLRQLTSELNI